MVYNHFCSELLNRFFANFIFPPVSMKFSVDINRSTTPKNTLWHFSTVFHGVVLLVHLGLNLILLRFCGIFSEKILGAGRFLILTIAARLGYAAAHSLPWID